MSYFRYPTTNRLAGLQDTEIPIDERFKRCTCLYFDVIEAASLVIAKQLTPRYDFAALSEVVEARAQLIIEFKAIHGDKSDEMLNPPRDGVMRNGITVWHQVIEASLLAMQEERMQSSEKMLCL
jgi:hypothetical protein